MSLDSVAEIGLACAAGQFLIALLLWFGIDSKSARKAIPKMNPKSKLVLILLIGGLVSCGYALYQLRFGHPAPDNVESYINDWTRHFSLNSRKSSNSDKYYFQYVLTPMSDDVAVYVARMKAQPNYLTLTSTAFDETTRNRFNALPKQSKLRFFDELVAETLRDGIGCSLGSGFLVEVTDIIPITADLTEYSFVKDLIKVHDSLNAVMFRARVCLDHVEPDSAIMQPLPTPDTAISPPAPTSP